MKAIDIISASSLRWSLQHPEDDGWMPQTGYTREALRQRFDAGEVVYYYRLQRRSIGIWARSKAKSVHGFLCCEINLYRWRLLPIEEVFARLDSMDFTPENKVVDALGMPIAELLSSEFYQNLDNFFPAAVEESVEESAEPIAVAVEESVEEPMEESVEESVDVTVSPAPAPMAAPMDPADVPHIEEPAEPELESASLHLLLQQERERVAAQQKEINQWRALYESTMDSEGDDRIPEAPAPVDVLTRPAWCLREDTLLSFLSGLKMVHLDWLWTLCALLSFFVLVFHVRANAPALWPIISTAVSASLLTLSLGVHNDGFFKFNWDK